MNPVILREAAKKHSHLILPPYDVIMNLDGFDAICAFSDHLSGCTTYIPSIKCIFQKCLEEEAKQNFNGNYAVLSRKFGFSERHLRRVIDGK